MEKMRKLDNDLTVEKDDIVKHKHEIEKLKDEKSREERKVKLAEEEKKSLQSTGVEKDGTIKKMEDDKSKREVESENLNKKMVLLEA